MCVFSHRTFWHHLYCESAKNAKHLWQQENGELSKLIFFFNSRNVSVLFHFNILFNSVHLTLEMDFCMLHIHTHSPTNTHIFLYNGRNNQHQASCKHIQSQKKARFLKKTCICMISFVVSRIHLISQLSSIKHTNFVCVCARVHVLHVDIFLLLI